MSRREDFMDTIYDFMQGAKVTVDGVEVDYNLIMPTPSNAMARSQLDQAEEGLTMFTNKDAPGLQSGRMEWTEMALDSTEGLTSNCGRSGHQHEKRARIIALQNEVVTKDLTSTTTVSETAATTKTFTIGLACTPSGFTFGIPECTMAPTGR